MLLKARGEGDSTFSVFTRASDAAAAALAAQQVLGDQDWPTAAPMSVRIALHTGEALERDGDYYGRTVNRVARLRSIAAGGQILLSQSTAELVRDHLSPDARLVELGDQALRDLDRPERVFALMAAGMATAVAPIDVVAAAPVVELPLPAPLMTFAGASFVGRDPELERLGGLWKEAAAGDRTSVFVAGEPGIGKTRLAAELADSAHAEGATVLYGRCDEDLDVPYQPFIEALRAFAANAPTDHLRTALGASAGELVRLLPELGPRLGLPAPSSADPDTDRYRLFEAVCTWLSTVSAARPLLFVVDDLHWATKATLLLLRHIVRSSEPTPLLVLGTYRDTEVSHALRELLADLATPSTHHRLELGGLDDVAVQALVEGALEGTAPALVERLQQETQGNPLFVAEMLRHLAESGALHVREHIETRTLRDVGVPEGVRAVIDRRVLRLSEAARRALSVAAVAGPMFSLHLLEHVPAAGDAHEVLDALDEGVGARLIAETPGSPGTYGFGHALVRQAVFDKLTATRRARLHREVGEALEELSNAEAIVLTVSGTTSHAWSGVVMDTRHADLRALAHHFLEAAQDERAPKAVRYATLAARQALDELAFEEALALLDRGTDVVEGSGRIDRELAADLFLVLAQALELAGDAVGHQEAALRAAEEARSAGSSERLALAAIAATSWLVVGRNRPEMAVLCQEALEALGSDSPALRSRVLARLAQYHSERGVPSLDMVCEAVDLARDADDDEALAEALDRNFVSSSGSADVANRAALADELLTLGVRTGNKGAYVQGLFHRERTRVELGDLRGFNAFLAEMERFALERRAWTVQSHAIVNRAFLALLRGRFDDAEAQAARALELSHHPLAPNVYGSQLFFLRREQGRLGEIAPMIERAAGQHPEWAVYRAALVLTYAEVGSLEAKTQFEDLAKERFAVITSGVSMLAPVAISMLAEVCALLGDALRAETLYDLLLPHAGHLIVVSDLIACNGAFDRYLGMLATTSEEYDEAEAYFRSALALEERVDSPPLIARTQMWYARMLLARDDRGDKARAGELLAAAQSTARSLGMNALAEQTSALSNQDTP